MAAAKSTKKGRTQLTVYPSPRSIQVLGSSSPALNQALDCWAYLIGRATLENAGRFSRAEWLYLADCGNSTMWTPEFDAARSIVHQVRDANELDGLGKKWLSKPSDVDKLAGKLEGLSYQEAWAVIVAVELFWDNHEDIDTGKDEWWTLDYRRTFFEGEES